MTIATFIKHFNNQMHIQDLIEERAMRHRDEVVRGIAVKSLQESIAPLTMIPEEDSVCSEIK